MANKFWDIAGTVLLFIGAFFAFLPHALHTAAGLSEQTSHTKHVVTGLILIVLGLGILIYNNKALNLLTKPK